MKLERAESTAQAELIHFYEQFTLKNQAEFRLSRNKDFLAPYRLQSDDYRTYVLRDLDQQIQAMASFVFRETDYMGERKTIGTALDLRVAPSRKAILEWSQHFLPVLSEVIAEKNLDFVFSSLDLNESSAMNTFVRPRQMKRPIPRYYLYRKYELVSIHGRWPWAQPPLRSLKISNAHAGNLDALIEYAVRRSHFRPFSSFWNKDSFLKKCDRLPGFKMSDFLVATDGQDNVVGCLAPWSGLGIHDYIPLSYTLRAHNFRQMLKFFWLFRQTRRLAKPVASTGIEAKLQFRYLTNVFADNEDIFESLIWSAYENVSKNEFLTYTHCKHDYRLLPPESWITASQPQALYAVVPPEKPMPDFLHPSIAENPEIEACYFL